MKHEIKEWFGKRKGLIKAAAIPVLTCLTVGAYYALKERYDIKCLETGMYKALDLGYLSLHDPSTGELVNSDEWCELIMNRKK